MENYIGMAAVIAAIIFSRSGRAVPLIILAYYVLCIASIDAFFGWLDNLDDTIISEQEVYTKWYIVQVLINSFVCVLLALLCSGSKIALFYACITAMSAIYNVAGLFFAAMSMDWYADVYLLHQQYAIQLDVVVAWLASDNAVSRKINRAFSNGAGTSDHEHGRQN